MHYFKTFKGFKNASIELFDGVAILIGNNGTGKTNIIEGIGLLANLATGRPLYEIVDIKRGEGSAFQIRGGLLSCPSHGSDKFTCGSSGTIKLSNESYNFDYSIEVTTKPSPRISKESFAVNDKKYFEAVASAKSKDMLSVTYANFTKGPNPITTRSSEKSIFSRYDDIISDVSNEIPQKNKAIAIASSVRASISASYVFDPNPSSMRYYERIGQLHLLKDGANLSSVLHRLQQMQSRKSPYINSAKAGDNTHNGISRILNVIRKVPEQPFLDFKFTRTRLNDVILALETETGIVDARLLSDGTLRCLAVLTAFETVSKGSLIVIEEIDNGLHSSRTGDLLEYITETCSRRKLNALITTHNPATLNKLSDKQLRGVNLCYWDKSKKCSAITPLLEIKDVELLLERGPLGDLAASGRIQKHMTTTRRRGESLTDLLGGR